MVKISMISSMNIKKTLIVIVLLFIMQAANAQNYLSSKEDLSNHSERIMKFLKDSNLKMHLKNFKDIGHYQKMNWFNWNPRQSSNLTWFRKDSVISLALIL